MTLLPCACHDAMPQVSYWVGFGRNEKLLSPNSKDPKLGYRSFVGLQQEKLIQLLLNDEKLKSVSCTSNILVRTCDFQKMHKIPSRC